MEILSVDGKRRPLMGSYGEETPVSAPCTNVSGKGKFTVSHAVRQKNHLSPGPKRPVAYRNRSIKTLFAAEL